VSEAELDRLMSYDDKCYCRPGSVWRRDFMHRWIKIPGGLTVMAVTQQGAVVGFGCRKPDVRDDRVHFVGPLYADSYDVAADLLHELTRDIAGHMLNLRIL